MLIENLFDQKLFGSKTCLIKKRFDQKIAEHKTCDQKMFDLFFDKNIDRAVHHGPQTQYRSNRTEYRIDRIEIRKKIKRPENREDGSDFDDFWTESIVSTQSIFSKSFE